jgi:hypothetical protein
VRGVPDEHRRRAAELAVVESGRTPQASTRTAAVLPWLRLAPISQLTSNIGAPIGRSRGSVPNGSEPNASA